MLLAGGESRRMGRDKATLEFQGKSLWQRQLEILRKLGPAEILVSARQDPPWRPNDIRFVADETPSRGPLSGLVAALSVIKNQHLVVLAIDMPSMNSSFLVSLVEQIGTGWGVVPRIRDCFEPLAAIYPRESGLDFAAALRNRELTLQAIVRRLVEKQKLRAFEVPESQRDFFRNINNPIDAAGA